MTFKESAAGKKASKGKKAKGVKIEAQQSEEEMNAWESIEDAGGFAVAADVKGEED